jgi:membrane protease YdiL (CAAX protease family)
MNPDASLWGAFAIAVQAGITLAVLYILTRSLWLAIGTHLAWNFWQIFLGLPVSGTPATTATGRPNSPAAPG